MASFTPFFCEHIWQNLRKVTGAPEESVHFTLLPQADETLIDSAVERRVEAMRSVIDLVRVLRKKASIPVKYPPKEMIVINRDSQFLEDVKSLEHYVLSELNVRKLTVSQDKEKYGISLKADINFRQLGARLKGDQKNVVNYLKQTASQEELERFLTEGKMVVLGHELSGDDMSVSYACGADAGNAEGYKALSDSETIVMLDTTEDESLKEEELAREAKLVATDSTVVYSQVKPKDNVLAQVVAAHRETIEKVTGTPVKLEPLPNGKTATTENVNNVKEAEVSLWLVAEGVVPNLNVSESLGGKSLRLKLENGGHPLTYSDLLSLRGSLRLRPVAEKTQSLHRRFPCASLRSRVSVGRKDAHREP